MIVPLEPKPGLVIRYSYLWRSEADRGRDEGVKDRPCAVILAIKRDDETTKVVVAPITHSQPQGGVASIEVPQATKIRLGLNDDRSWIITSEVNVFTWQGPDLRPANPRHPEREPAFGYLPGPLTRAMIESVRREMVRHRGKSVDRDE